MGRRSLARLIRIAIAGLAAAAAALFAWAFADLPDPFSLSGRGGLESTKVLDRNGVVLFEMPGQDVGKRTRVSLGEFPPYLRQATIATEDSTFYHNPGVDLIGVARAFLANVRGREVVGGGSTITQQLVRTAILSPEEKEQRTIRRKVREAALALIITGLHSKDEVLEAYLNEAYYGNMAYGAEAAAEAYFGKHARDLDLAESALLAGLTQSPANYNPLLNPDAARRRQAIVLDLMAANGYITAQEAVMAKGEKLTFAPAPFDIKAPHFVTYVQDLLDKAAVGPKAPGRGLRVMTTLDYSLQSAAKEIIRTQLAQLKDENVTNAAVVALDPRTGDILAMVGSADYFDKGIDGSVNVATSPRQPGSAIKPITYAAAFSRGWTPATVVADVRTAFPTREGTPFVPANYDYAYRGPVSLRQALGSSINVPAVKVLEFVGLAEFIDLAHQLGISSLVDSSQYGLSLTLGGGEMTLLELSAAYAVFANGGVKQPVRAILRIEDNRGNILDRGEPDTAEQVLDPRVAFLIGDILSDESARRLTFGAFSPLYVGRPAAVKTGTTSSWRDNWTVGYTPDLVVGVWAGNADGSPMKRVSGVTGAAPIWHDFMVEVGKVRAALPFTEPPGLVHLDVCPESGQLPGPYCPYRKREAFVAGSEPWETCSIHQKVRVCLVHNRLATPNCPADEIEEKVFAVYPPDLLAWAEEAGLPKAPTDYCDLHGRPTDESSVKPIVLLTSPDDGSEFAIDATRPPEIQRIEIAAVANADPAAVGFLVDGLELAIVKRRPYSLLWQLVSGRHTISAIALDERGNELARSEVRIRVEGKEPK